MIISGGPATPTFEQVYAEGYRGYPVGTVVGLWPITLGGIRMDSVDEHFVEWSVTSFDGRGFAAPSGEMAERPSDHGSVGLGPWYRQPDQFTIAGSADCGTPEARFAAEERLRRMLAATDVLMVLHDEVTRQQGVRLYGKVAITRPSPTVFTFEIPLIALDPRLYSVELRRLSDAAVNAATPLAVPHKVPHQVPVSTIIRTAETWGTETAWPLWTLTGPMVNPAITNQKTGASMRFDLTIQAGQTLVVDTHPSARTVLLNGERDLSRRAAMFGQWWGLAPGITQVLFTSSPPRAAANQLAGQWRDSWL